jgi:hypothetical protein
MHEQTLLSRCTKGLLALVLPGIHIYRFAARFDPMPPLVAGVSLRPKMLSSDVLLGVAIMKTTSLPTSRTDASESQGLRTGRRRLVVGASVAAGAALAAAALQRKADPATPTVAADTGAAPAQGYRLTDHVRRYYETTRS